MNLGLFYFLRQATGISPLIDAAIIFVADYLAFVFFFALLSYEGWQWMKGREARARMLLQAIGFAGMVWILAEVLKRFIASPRPFLVIDGLEPLIRHGDYDSFPSGHVAFFFALGVTVYLSRYRLSPERPVRTKIAAAGLSFMVVALLMGLARIAAGIHWPVDILGGVLLGSLVVVFIPSRIFL